MKVTSVRHTAPLRSNRSAQPKAALSDLPAERLELGGENGILHAVEVPFKGSKRTLSVRVDSKLCQALDKKGLKLDLPQAELITPDGKRAPLFQSDGDHPWTFLDPDRGYAGLPTTEVRLQLSESGKLQVKASPPFEPEFHFFRDRPFSVVPPGPEALEPMAQTDWLAQPKEVFGSQVFAPTPEGREKAAAAFRSICGPKAEGWAETERTLLAEKAGLEEHLDLLEAGGPAEQMMAAAALGGATPEQAQAVALARLNRLNQRLYEPMIFVVPDEKHWTTLPFLKDSQESLLSDPAGRSNAAILGTEAGWMIFVPESDLDNGGHALRHELYHLLEDKYLSDKERAVLDQHYSEVKEQGGPFQSTYGYQRREFFTTLGEEFEGEWGAEGREWLKEHHKPVLDLIRETTGRE